MVFEMMYLLLEVTELGFKSSKQRRKDNKREEKHIWLNYNTASLLEKYMENDHKRKRVSWCKHA